MLSLSISLALIARSKRIAGCTVKCLLFVFFIVMGLQYFKLCFPFPFLVSHWPDATIKLNSSSTTSSGIDG
jgi:hypothetical protein